MSNVSRLSDFSTIRAQIEQRRLGGRKLVRHGGRLCSRCLDAPPVSSKGGYCRACHAEYQRERREKLRADSISSLPQRKKAGTG